MAKKYNKTKKNTKTGKKPKRVRFSKKNKVYTIKRRAAKRGRKMKGGSIKNTMLPSPVINGWYDLMSAPKSLLMSYDGVEYPDSIFSDPLKGHNL